VREAHFGAVDDAVADPFYEGQEVVVFGVKHGFVEGGLGYGVLVLGIALVREGREGRCTSMACNRSMVSASGVYVFVGLGRIVSRSQWP
jgi:hypothetical protein